MATTRSRKRSNSIGAIAARQRRAELKVAREAADARKAPGSPKDFLDRLSAFMPKMVGEAVDQGLQPIARRLLVLEARLDGASEASAVVVPFASRAAECDPCQTGASRPSGIIEDSADRVRSLTQRVQGARNVLRSKYERLFGSIPEASGKADAVAPALNGDVHVLHSVISELDAAIDSLHHEVDRLAGL